MDYKATALASYATPANKAVDKADRNRRVGNSLTSYRYARNDGRYFYPLGKYPHERLKNILQEKRINLFLVFLIACFPSRRPEFFYFIV